MRQSAMLRFLELLQAELGADDARAELGGKDPTDPRALFTVIPGGFRVVALFAEPPHDREMKQHKLDELARGFGYTLSQGSVPAPPPSPADTAQKRLDTALGNTACKPRCALGYIAGFPRAGSRRLLHTSFSCAMSKRR